VVDEDQKKGDAAEEIEPEITHTGCRSGRSLGARPGDARATSQAV
jgi:hypothetical protein